MQFINRREVGKQSSRTASVCYLPFSPRCPERQQRVESGPRNSENRPLDTDFLVTGRASTHCCPSQTTDSTSAQAEHRTLNFTDPMVCFIDPSSFDRSDIRLRDLQNRQGSCGLSHVRPCIQLGNRQCHSDAGEFHRVTRFIGDVEPAYVALAAVDFDLLRVLADQDVFLQRGEARRGGDKRAVFRAGQWFPCWARELRRPVPGR